MVINENRLRNMIRRLLSETMDRSYRYDIHHEIPNRVPDWEHDSWDDETDERNRERLSRRLGGRDMTHFTYPNGGKGTSVDSVMRKMGFKRLAFSEFMGGGVGDDVKKFIIEKGRYAEIKKQFESALNFFNYRVIKMYGYNGNDFGYDIDGLYVAIEPVFTSEVKMKEDGIYYHVTPERNVDKILRQGLVPKDRGQLGVKRPERIYLSPYFDESLVERLERDNGMPYVGLKINLKGMDVKLYNDPYYNGEAVYIVGVIPPNRVKVMDTQPHKAKREREKQFSMWIEELCNELGLVYYPEYNAVHGEYNGMEIDLQIYISENGAFFAPVVNGTIIKTNKNGKRLKTTWRTNGYISVGGNSCFRYEDVKSVIIDKVLRKILTTGSKVGLGNC